MDVLIKGVKYKVKLLSKAAFIKKHTDTDLAFLEKESKTLVFRKDQIKKNIVIHEVTHCFIDSLGLGSCNDLSINDFEEIICEMMELHLMDINSVSNEVMAYLKDSK